MIGTSASRKQVTSRRPDQHIRFTDGVHRDAVRAHLLQAAEAESQPRVAGQTVGVTQVGERTWLVTFMRYDLGYFDDEMCRLEPIENPFSPKVLPMSSE